MIKQPVKATQWAISAHSRGKSLDGLVLRMCKQSNTNFIYHRPFSVAIQRPLGNNGDETVQNSLRSDPGRTSSGSRSPSERWVIRMQGLRELFVFEKNTSMYPPQIAPNARRSLTKNISCPKTFGSKKKPIGAAAQIFLWTVIPNSADFAAPIPNSARCETLIPN